MQEAIIEGVVSELKPFLQSLIERVTVLEQREKDQIEYPRMAAYINELESLKAQVKTLQFEVARLEYQLEGKAEPSPWSNL